ncbi:MAG: FxsA family protein [Myxococcota bacterium]
MGLLAALFIVVPAVELALLAEVGVRIGWLPTLGIVIATGFIGAALARSQGFAVLRRIREESAQGRAPTDALTDGAMVLVAGTLLITPGVLTDMVGFALLIPPLRAVLKGFVAARLARSVQAGRTAVFYGAVPPSGVPPGAPNSRVTPSDPDRIYEATFDDD